MATGAMTAQAAVGVAGVAVGFALGVIACRGNGTAPIRAVSMTASTSSKPISAQIVRTRRKSKECDEKKLKAAFAKMDLDGSNELNLQEFIKICGKDHLQLDVDEEALARLFKRLVKHSKTDALDYEGFARAVHDAPFFSAIVSNYEDEIPFAIPSTFDYSKRTVDNFRSEGYLVDGEYGSKWGTSKVKVYDKALHGELFGEYQDIRKRLDFSYHMNLNKERQEWQDALVRSVVVRTVPQPRPWLVFTCGAMGAGKGYVMKWLSRHGFFPLENVVHIDMDMFRQKMPEWPEYVAQQDDSTPELKEATNAAKKTQNEANAIQEIAQEVALRARQNTWIDGSLRDHDWYGNNVIPEIRHKYPHYRLAIFYIYCSHEQVFERSRKRAEKTGRQVPEKVTRDSIIATEKSVEILSEKVDYVAKIKNEGPVPQLMSFETMDTSGQWTAIHSRFSRLAELSAEDFPKALPSISIQPIYKPAVDPGSPIQALSLSADTTGVLRATIDTSKWLEVHSTSSETAKKALLASIAKDGTASNLSWSLSPEAAINLDLESRELAAIPATATHFAFAPPPPTTLVTAGCEESCISEIKHKTGVKPTDAAANFLLGGGFLYFELVEDNAGTGPMCNILGVNAISVLCTGTSQNMLTFRPPLNLDASMVEKLTATKQWSAVTMDYLLAGGVTQVAWVPPNVLVSAPYGAFAYKFKTEQQPLLFPVAEIDE